MTDLRQRNAGATTISMTPVGVKLTLPGETVDRAAERLIGDPFPTTKGASVGMQFGEWGKAMLWAPYDKPNYPFRWVPWLSTMFICFVLATTMGTVIPVLASWPTSVGANLNVAVATAGMYLLGMSFRAADMIPQLMHPCLVFIESIHGHIGILSIGIWMIACMIAGGALSAPILSAIGGTVIENYATALRPVSFWGAVGIVLCTSALAAYTYEQNTPVKHYHLLAVREGRKGSVRGFSKLSIFFALVNGIVVFITYSNGLFSAGNLEVTFGSYINTGGWSTPDTAACTLSLAWPFLGYLAGWALHLLTWNVKGLSADQVQMAAEEEEAADM
jgi:hypothetical protein